MEIPLQRAHAARPLSAAGDGIQRKASAPMNSRHDPGREARPTSVRLGLPHPRATPPIHNRLQNEAGLERRVSPPNSRPLFPPPGGERAVSAHEFLLSASDGKTGRARPQGRGRQARSFRVPESPSKQGTRPIQPRSSSGLPLWWRSWRRASPPWY